MINTINKNLNLQNQSNNNKYCKNDKIELKKISKILLFNYNN